MAKKLMSWKTKGMNQDLSVSAFNPEFSFENMNLRLSTNETNTTLSWVNEKGTKQAEIYKVQYNTETKEEDQVSCSILGVPVGTAVINHQLILFTHDTQNYDHIYKLVRRGVGFAVEELTEDHQFVLNLDTHYPLETIVSYESDSIQKVYWTDGKNQPRVVNVAASAQKRKLWNNTSFDFIPEFTSTNTNFEVTKNTTGGMFSPGVIQYCFTYYNKYGQQTNIVKVSSLYYITTATRSADPEEKVDNSFKISIKNIDTNFDFIRLYSIQRTSLDAQVIAKRVTDLPVPHVSDDTSDDTFDDTITYIDTGTTGDTIDPTLLLYVGGNKIIADTLVDKDNTLFLGNIEQPESGESLPLVEPPNSNGIILKKGSLQFYCQHGVLGGIKTIDYGKAPNGSLYYNYFTLRNNPRDVITTFKGGERYRFGVQFKNKTGEWTEPTWLGDKDNDKYPNDTNGIVNLAYAQASIDVSYAVERGYVAARPLIVYPNASERKVLCQGVLNPTVFNVKGRMSGITYSQASWFFRPFVLTNTEEMLNQNDDNEKKNGYRLEFRHYASLPSSKNVEDTPFPVDRDVEIQGAFSEIDTIEGTKKIEDLKSNTQFFVDQSIVTLNSPDVEFNTETQNSSLQNLKLRIVGVIPISSYTSYCDITTNSISFPTNYKYEVNTETGESSTPTTSTDTNVTYGIGLIDKTVTKTIGSKYTGRRFITDYIWDDVSIVRDYKKNKEVTQTSIITYQYAVYPWHRTGSLNNDKNIESDASSVLQTKQTSHLLYSSNTRYLKFPEQDSTDEKEKEMLDVGYADVSLHLVQNDFVEVLRLPYKLREEDEKSLVTYYPNVDTVLVNTNGYYIWKQYTVTYTGQESKSNRFNSAQEDKTYAPVSMKYKSNTHYVIGLSQDDPSGQYMFTRILPGGKVGSNKVINSYKAFGGSRVFWEYESKEFTFDVASDRDITKYVSEEDYAWLWLGELYKNVDNNTIFGGNSPEAIRTNKWFIGGEEVPLSATATGIIVLQWTEGDTYYQRYDCLKTYPFTFEDINQNTEILSFMCETRVNIDGRYDENRGLQDNTNVSPTNFNRLNPIYNQKNNFFTYRQLDHDSNSKSKYPNWITFTGTKESGADVDEWTHITLASTLEMDGNKGELRALRRFNNQILAFQDRGLAHILFNENNMLTTQAGVPIEIGNSGKVTGKTYVSDTVGCTNKWSICTTPAGLYFMDSNAKGIFLFNGQLDNLTTSKGMNTWAKNNISSDTWDPSSFGGFVSYYDQHNQDVLFINSSEALAYSEKIGTFTSFYSYGNAPFFCNLDDESLWLTYDYAIGSSTNINTLLWHHQKGDYCRFFGNNKPYWMTLVCNPEPQKDKIFTNLEFRACIDGEGEDVTITEDTASLSTLPRPKRVQVRIPNNTSEDKGPTTITYVNKTRYEPYLPFDQLETWNEYQHGITALSNKHGKDLSKHQYSSGDSSSLIRKFRIWRCDVPRDNVDSEGVFSRAFSLIFKKSRKAHKIDRMRNPWLYVTLMKNAAVDDTVGANFYSLPRAEVHDLAMIYYE